MGYGAADIDYISLPFLQLPLIKNTLYLHGNSCHGNGVLVTPVTFKVSKETDHWHGGMGSIFFFAFYLAQFQIHYAPKQSSWQRTIVSADQQYFISGCANSLIHFQISYIRRSDFISERGILNMSTDRQVLNFHKSISEIDFCYSTPPQGILDTSEGE